MTQFRFEAAQADGKLAQGTLDADSVRQVKQQLRTRGWMPLEVTPIGQAQAGTDPARRLHWRGLSDTDRADITRQLASLLQAQLPIESALSAALEQAERPYIRQLLSTVRSELRGGARFADALGSRPRDFPEIYRALVAAGEASGDLAEVMQGLADYIEARNLLRSKLLTAFLYPIIVSLVSCAIVMFLLTYVVPQVVSAFSQSRQALPTLTLAMLALSDLLRRFGGAALLGLMALIAGLRQALQSPRLKQRWHARLLRLPVVGRYSRSLNSARFASTLAILTNSGVPLLSALEAAGKTLSNLALRKAVASAAASVREGVPLAHALQREQCFPPLLIHLISSGERTGRVAEMLDRAALTLSRDLERRALRLTALLEPLLILAMGGVVLLIVLAVLMPIIEINQLVR